MDTPPRVKKSPNATIQLDRFELDEILLTDTSEPLPPAASVPPPLPPEEIARAQSLAPMAGVTSAASEPNSPRRGILIAAGFVVLVAIAIGGGIAVGGAFRGPAQPAASSAPVAASTSPARGSAPNAATEPTGATMTIHTMELGGKTNGDE